MREILCCVAGAIIGFFAGIFFNEGTNKKSNDKYYRD
jgi:hypothetical protein